MGNNYLKNDIRVVYQIRNTNCIKTVQLYLFINPN